MSDIDNADQIFDPQSDNRSEFDKAMDQLSPDQADYLKAIKAMQDSAFSRLDGLKSQPQAHIFAIGSSAQREYLVRTYKLGVVGVTDPDFTALLNQGWTFGQVTYGYKSVFQVLFWRGKNADSQVAEGRETLVAGDENSSVAFKENLSSGI